MSIESGKSRLSTVIALFAGLLLSPHPLLANDACPVDMVQAGSSCKALRRAVAIACNPATPTPMTNTRAAEIVPAAVIIIGKARP